MKETLIRENVADEKFKIKTWPQENSCVICLFKLRRAYFWPLIVGAYRGAMESRNHQHDHHDLLERSSHDDDHHHIALLHHANHIIFLNSSLNFFPPFPLSIVEKEEKVFFEI